MIGTSMKCCSPEYATTAVVDVERLRPRQAVNRGVQQHVLLAGQFGMEPGAELDHAADPRAAGDEQLAGGRPVDAGDDLEERALARSVAADEPHRFALTNLQRHRLERPELLDPLPPRQVEEAEQPHFQFGRGVVPEEEPFGQVPRFEDEGQIRYAPRSCLRCGRSATGRGRG